jgi:hypothetical protein
VVKGSEAAQIAFRRPSDHALSRAAAQGRSPSKISPLHLI